ncbi:hypothetical protein HPT25_00625 [Bacillus sp. BRMEA1]|uniref:hypothetical protein n=1 Tax=Neobacillus endophyticus TaxID=2738405 RepID=UPI001566BE5F|nr:hypothetical protein [Neobacillus endophyticus]NRD76011.1 hypothetical protein [Neobacillus endophyticus]
MLKEEKGYTLLTVMLILLVFTVLGLSILTVSINGASRTEIRKESIEDNLDAIRNLNEAVAYIKATVNNNYNPGMSIDDFSQFVTNNLLNNPYGYQITDVRPDLKQFTRVLNVTSQTKKSAAFQQTVYITPMPSFLKYAIGSRDILTINGSLYLKEGNIYAKNGLEISNQAKYIYGDSQKEVATTFPSVLSNSQNYLFLDDNNVSYCNYVNGNCYNGGIKQAFLPLDTSKINSVFDPIAPTVAKDDTDFVEVDIVKTFIDKLKNCGIIDPGFNVSNLSSEALVNQAIDSINETAKSGTPDVQVITDFNNLKNTDSLKSYIYNGDAYIDTNNLSIDNSKWLVINGNANFENSGTDTMNVSGNILVTGNVSIKGKVAFNSTMYVLGKTTIDNVDISGLDNGELILMSQGTLEIAKLNKFVNPDSSNLDQVNSIKAFLYTNSDAVVYAIGSYINIDGGLFAHGNLEVNAFRGKTYDNNTDLHFEPETDEKASRLIIQNNKKLFLNHAEGLPKVDQLEVLTDLMKQN